MRYKEIECVSKSGAKSCIVMSTFAGKPVKGIAKCDTSKDTYDREKGMALAKARCDVKVAEKRLARATEKLVEAKYMMTCVEDRIDKMENYAVDSAYELATARAVLAQLEKEM